MTINDHKIIHHRESRRLMQVNWAIHSIEKSHVIIVHNKHREWYGRVCAAYMHLGWTFTCLLMCACKRSGGDSVYVCLCVCLGSDACRAGLPVPVLAALSGQCGAQASLTLVVSGWPPELLAHKQTTWTLSLFSITVFSLPPSLPFFLSLSLSLSPLTLLAHYVSPLTFESRVIRRTGWRL